ncbi:MAG: class I SAM-dependent methyltransferase [Proteobacteria bacterium]|nr:class I SAM-dependent methyltransferase [Pseudomonadota bacterium]
MSDKLPQPMRPSGRVGRVFGWLMARLNQRAYRWTIDKLRPVQPKSILEIGFGTGHLLQLAIHNLNVSKVVGVDPSELMFETARQRLRRYRKKAELDLKLGDDSAIPAQGQFDAIAALHCFQFWPTPEETLAKLRGLLSPNGRFVLVLRRRYSKSVAKSLPNPISRGNNEIADACAAAERAGFVIQGMQGISKTSHGIILGCG